jgi:Predicted enzyme with a TIM-barrel fold
MCLPPLGLEPKPFFSEMKKISVDLNLNELSMGMSSDYMEAIEYKSTYLRIGSNIFGKRS